MSILAGGWIKVHRKLLENSLWENCTAEQKVIFITLLLMANHEEKEWIFKGEKYICKPGQFVTSLKSIQEKVGKDISIMQIRRSLEKFEVYQFLTSKSTNKNRLITIENWELYQTKEDTPTDKPTSNRQATDKQPTTNKNIRNKEYKNNNINIYSANDHEQNKKSKDEDVISESCRRIWAAYPLKKGKSHAITAIKSLLKKYKEQAILDAIVVYVNDVEKQRKNGFKELQFKNGSTFFRSGIHDYIGGEDNADVSGENEKNREGIVDENVRRFYDNAEEI